MDLFISFVDPTKEADMPELNENATLVERMQFYINFDDKEKAKALAIVGDFLEECYCWDIDFDGPHIEA